MHQYCVVVANGSQARFFTLEDDKHHDPEYGPTLIEANQMYHPDHEPLEQTRSQRLHDSYNSKSQPKSAIAEHDKRFANSIAKEVTRISRECDSSDLVLVSQKYMLKHIKNAMPEKLKSMHTRELARDLSKLSPYEIHNFLAREKLIPERKAPKL
jgi:protein required for attachment to host cells